MLDGILKDLVAHTAGLGFIDVVKITGDKKTTNVDGIAEDKSVVIRAEFDEVIPEFTGTFGLPNLGKLNVILGIPEYKEKAEIDVHTQEREGVKTPVSITFENAAKDFRNEYRLMSSEIITARIPTARFKGANWDISIEPSLANIQRLKFQAQANSDESNFSVKVDKGNLKFFFGDHSSHAGNFVFAEDVTGNLKQTWTYPIAQVQSVLASSGDKVMQFSDAGAMMITVLSGVAKYEYIFPAMCK